MHTWLQPCRVVQSLNLPHCQDPGLLSQITLWFAGFVTVLTNTWDFELENLRSSNFHKIAVKKLRLKWGWWGKFPYYHLTMLLIRVFGKPKDGIFSKFWIVWDIKASKLHLPCKFGNWTRIASYGMYNSDCLWWQFLWRENMMTENRSNDPCQPALMLTHVDQWSLTRTTTTAANLSFGYLALWNV